VLNFFGEPVPQTISHVNVPLAGDHPAPVEKLASRNYRRTVQSRRCRMDSQKHNYGMFDGKVEQIGWAGQRSARPDRAGQGLARPDRAGQGLARQGMGPYGRQFNTNISANRTANAADSVQ
jgi:hypothetical protein